MVAPESILLFHTGALGDFVLTWPLTRALSRLYPSKRIHYITHHSKARLAGRFLDTGAWDIETNGWHSLFSDTPKLSAPADELLAGAHTLISFLASPGDPLAANLAALVPPARILTLNALLPTDYSGHMATFYREQLPGPLGSAMQQEIEQIGRHGIAAGRRESARILLHPGSGSRAKCWPAQNYARLAERLVLDGCPVAILLGEVEAERFSDGQLRALADAAPILRPADYLQLADELLNCRLLITNDNGPGHLAAILGTRVLSLFGPTNPANWHPLGPQTRVLIADPLNSLPVDRVYEAAISSGN